MSSEGKHSTGNSGEETKADGLAYFSGFGNTFESEVLEGALPIGRNNPRLVPYNLYAEQLSGTAFTAPRVENRRVWLYRIQPSVVVGDAQPTGRVFGETSRKDCRPTVDPLRWRPFGLQPNVDFVDGTRLLCHGGDPACKQGLAIYMYSCGQSMSATRTCMYNTDGEWLLVPQQGTLQVITEMGELRVEPCEICVLPRGMVFQINMIANGAEETAARGYLLEIYSGGFQLPELGPIGSNGLANARDFLYPTAACVLSQEAYQQSHRIVTKLDGKLYEKTSDHSPFNVVAWHGNYLPYKYDLRRFCAVNSVTYDHLDPSIYTVLTCQTDRIGTAMADFVIFPPRIMATDSNTFRPPWYHRNTMSEFMGLIAGQYDAKEGFMPGGASLHNCMTPHGPDEATHRKATADACEKPTKFDGGLAFMFETCLPLNVAPAALDEASGWREGEYTDCWQVLVDNFSGWDQLEQLKK